ncbi:MAG: bifunctional folylpolyglutamate synthase/dihydrofolate synthase [Eggerthella lenta]
MSFDHIAYINEPRWLESRLGLDRIRELLDRLGRPQDRLKFVHVAGTNGKGSTCAYLASILQAAGLRTGLFTSPYLITFEERIRVDGANITLDELTEATLLVKGQAEAMADHPTEFELMTAVALVHFVRRGCDIVVLEVGLGGRLDSTNAIDAPEAAVIARIGLDHTKLLGTTLAAIAGEKAGIVKPGCRGVVAAGRRSDGRGRAGGRGGGRYAHRARFRVLELGRGLGRFRRARALVRTGASPTCARSCWDRTSRRTRRWPSR